MIDKKILLYSVLQFNHSKRFRDKWRINLPTLHLLCNLYYSEQFMEPPKRGGVKTRLRTMNPQLNYSSMGDYLNTLQRAGLIEYKSGNNLQSHTMHTTKEGRNLINELYSVPSIGELLNKY